MGPSRTGSPSSPSRSSRDTPIYRVERAIFVTALWAMFRPKVTGPGEHSEGGPGDPGPGAPLVRRLRLRRVLHGPQALLHDQGRDVEEQVARQAAAHCRRLPRAPRVGRPRGAPGAEAVLRKDQRARPLSRGHPARGPGDRGPHGGRGVLVGRTGRTRSCRSASGARTSPCRRAAPSPSPRRSKW